MSPGSSLLPRVLPPFSIVRRAALLLLILGAAFLGGELRAAARPNLVVILCDDLGYGDLGCFGHPVIRTPHLDALAAAGLRLTNCYSAAPVCSPSRVGLLTGRSPNRAGVYDWIPPAGKPRPDRRELVHMRRSEVTIAQLLKEAGYATCMAGKWHCNSKFNDPAQPQPGDFGFDHWMATQNNAAPSHANPRNFVVNGAAVGEQRGFSCELTVAEADRWLRRHHAANPAQPFFLYLPFHEPHEPVASPEDLVEHYLPKAKNRDEAHYFANVANVDRAVGKLVKLLDELDLADDTLIFFTSDNGPETLNRYRGAQRSYGRPGPLRGMKLWTTDAGFRVAGILRWPSGLRRRGVSHEVVSSLDLLPTFCDLAGVSLPERTLDGTSLAAFLKDQPLARPKPLFWCYYNAINQQRAALRSGPWKMLAQLDEGKFPKLVNVHLGNVEQVRRAELTDFELFHISEDTGEAREVSGEHPEVAAELAAQMKQMYRELRRESHVWSGSDAATEPN